MKNLLLVIMMLVSIGISTGVMATTTCLEEVKTTYVEEVKTIYVRGTIDSPDGSWRYFGWIEDDGHFDIWLFGPDGNIYHLTGQNNGQGGSDSNLYNEDNEEVSLETIPLQLLLNDIFNSDG